MKIDKIQDLEGELEVGVYEERLWDLISYYEKSPSGDLITQGG